VGKTPLVEDLVRRLFSTSALPLSSLCPKPYKQETYRYQQTTPLQLTNVQTEQQYTVDSG
jgi:hypothetical protein